MHVGISEFFLENHMLVFEASTEPKEFCAPVFLGDLLRAICLKLSRSGLGAYIRNEEICIHIPLILIVVVLDGAQLFLVIKDVEEVDPVRPGSEPIT